jgi:hypothetical protein
MIRIRKTAGTWPIRETKPGLRTMMPLRFDSETMMAMSEVNN